MGGNHEPPKRAECNGWSAGAARRNAQFLKSVVVDGLDGVGVSFTLTVARTPATADEWGRLVKALLQAVRRMGVIRGHWCVEWQERGAPHLHGVAYFPPGEDARSRGGAIVEHWLRQTGHLGTAFRAQHAVPIRTVGHWLQYLAKHTARSVFHYQRARCSLPVAWRGRTGRVWGRVGDWPLSAEKVEVLDETFWRFRRWMRRYALQLARERLERARGRGCPGEIKAARNGLQRARAAARVVDVREDRPRCEAQAVAFMEYLSAVKAIPAVWGPPEAVQRRMVDLAGGAAVTEPIL